MPEANAADQCRGSAAPPPPPASGLTTLPRARRTARTGPALLQAGVIQPEQIAEIDAVAARYAVAITPGLLDLIDPADPEDPIARQFIPDPRELQTAAGELSDPIGDERFSPVKGIVHRYPDRVLLTPLHHCPVYCRFCFRRSVVGGVDTAAGAGVLSDSDLMAALDYIRTTPQIREVILTGGDPLMLPPARLLLLLQQLDAIPHLDLIRLHSRIPVGDPARITPALLDGFSALDKALWLVVHCNHPREITPPVQTVFRQISRCGIPLLAQTVLLKGVNDDPAVMEDLLRTLIRHRVKPYYLHHLDLAPGTSHFRLPVAHGQEIMRHLRGRLSGLAHPAYVLDIPGGHGKALLGPSAWNPQTAEVEDWNGQIHAYPVGNNTAPQKE